MKPGIRQAPDSAEFHTRLHLVHWLVLGASLGLTVLAWFVSSNLIAERHRLRFEQAAAETVERFAERLRLYDNTLRAGVGFARAEQAAGGVSLRDWQTLVSSLELPQRLGGLSGLALVDRVPRAELAAYNARVAQEYGELGFAVWPPVAADEHLPVRYVAPLTPNQEVAGLDLAFEEQRRLAAQRALESGQVQMTGPITLVQDMRHSPGFVLYAPLAPQGEALARGPALVAAAFVAEDLLASLDLASEHLTLSLRDGGTFLLQQSAETHADYDPYPMFSSELSLPLYGREWIFELRSSQSFRAEFASNLPTLILIGGLTVDLLLLGVFLVLVHANARAHELARQMTASLRRSEIELKKRNEELIQFNYRVSHDLVAPLRTLQGLVQMAKEDLRDAEYKDLGGGLDRIETMVDQQVRVISSIFDLCESDLRVEEYARIPLKPLIKRLFLQVLRMHPEARVELQLPFADDVSVAAKPVRLEQILLNLLSNAVKYRSQERSRPLIEVTVEQAAGWTTLRVRDNGIGIPNNALPHVFELFFRAHSSSMGGAGLGTYIVRKNIENMGGNARVYSDSNGTAFEVEWPTKQPEELAA